MKMGHRSILSASLSFLALGGGGINLFNVFAETDIFTDPAGWKPTTTFPAEARQDAPDEEPSYAFDNDFLQTLGGREATVVSVTNNGAAGIINLWGVHREGYPSNGRAFDRDIFLDVRGGAFNKVSAGLAAWWTGTENASVKGRQLTQIAGTARVNHVFGAGEQGGLDPVLEGDAGVVVKGSAAVLGTVVGGWTTSQSKIPKITGGAAVRIENVQGETSADAFVGELKPGLIIGGSAWGWNAGSGSEIGGDTSVTVAIDPGSVPDPTNFVKGIIGGSRSAEEGMTATTNGRPYSGDQTVGGNASVTISAPVRVTFTEPICAGGMDPAPDGNETNGTVTVEGAATLTLNGGTFANSLNAGIANGEKKIVFGGTNILAAGVSLSGFGRAEFRAGGVTRIAGTVSLDDVGDAAAGDGAALELLAGGSLSYNAAIGGGLPTFTKLDGSVTVTDCKMDFGQIASGAAVPVAKVDGPDLAAVTNAFRGTVSSIRGAVFPALFMLGEGGVVTIKAGADPRRLTYTEKPETPDFTWDKGEGIFDGETFNDYDNVAFRENEALPGQQVTVNVPSRILAGQVEIGSGFTFAGQTINAHLLVKRGAGESSAACNVKAGDVVVAEGSLAAGLLDAGAVSVSDGAALRAKLADRRAMRFLRLTVTESDPGGSAIKELRLFRKAPGGGYEKIEWPAGTWTSAGCLIDGIFGWEPTQQKWWAQTLPATAVIEFPEAIPSADGYNLCNGDWNKITRSPKAWTVEISSDGEEDTWTTVSDVKDAWAGNVSWFNTDIGGGANAPAFLFDAPADGIADVTVAKGGTLVADGDWTADMTLEGGAVLRAVPGGRLKIRTAPGSKASFGTEPKVKIDIAGYDDPSAGRHYIIEGDAGAWPDLTAIETSGAADGKSLGKDDNKGYYVDLPARTLAWGPADDDADKKWAAGHPSIPWRLADASAGGGRTLFRNGDSVVFGGLGGGPAVVNVSGEVRPASAVFNATDGTAYLLRPAEGSDAGIFLEGQLNVAGGATVTNGVPGSIAGPAAFEDGGTLVLAAASGLQKISGEISGAGSLVKDGAGKAEITGRIAHTGSFAVNGGTLTVNAENAFPATGENPLSVGPGAAIRFTGGGRNRMAGGAWLSCDAGEIVLADDSDNFPNEPNAPNFVLKNGATLKVETRDNNHLGRLELYDSRIAIPNTWREQRINAGAIVAGGASGASYYTATPDGKKGNDQIVVRETIEVLAGGRFDVGVAVTSNGGSAIAKTGPGTLAVSNGAVFETPLAFNEGTLELPGEAGSFERPATFADGTEIDLSGRNAAGPYDWGENLAVEAGDKVSVRAWDDAGVGDVLMTWDEGHEPVGKFILIGRIGLALRKTGTALEVSSGGTVMIFR